MPLHQLPLTFADYCSFVTATLYFVQPGVDRKAVMQWLMDNVFGSPRNFAWWGIFVGHKVVEWGVLSFYSLLYKLELPIFERHRAFPHKPWPWKDPRPEIRAEARSLRDKAFWYIVKFHSVVFLVNYFAGGFITDDMPQPNYMPETVPEWYTSLWQVLAGTIVAETGFYWGHRLLHKPWLYWAHKKHHEFKDCTVWATFYVTPLDALITDIIPAGLPLFLFNMHIYTIYMYTLPLILNAAWVHCGYELPFRFNPLLALPLSTQSEAMHDVHHRTSRHNFGGAYFLWDRLAGTYRVPLPLVITPKDESDAAKQKKQIIATLDSERDVTQTNEDKSD
jgi:sterol desaturase/sphingolipid hydroxylase (fatty acid hydroxylase superfamily)